MRVRPARVAGATALTLSCLALVGCDATAPLTGGDQSTDETTAAAGTTAEPRLQTNLPKKASTVPVSTLLEVKATDATLERVEVTSPAGTLPGKVAADGTTWQATERLEPGTTYTVKAVARGAEGETVQERGRFTSESLTLADQTYASIAPLDGETVGIGMPVVVSFDLPVTDHARFEKHMDVSSSPAQPGSWHWISDTEVHWRPKEYWKPGTEVDVDLDVNGVEAGGGIYGQEDREIDFAVGDAHIYRVDTDTHQMKVFSNGELIRTLPVSTGEEPTYTTRSGTKVIMSKHRYYDMNSGSIGIDPESAEGYDLSDVEYAMRITSSGEFIHAAPWSVASHGVANVSHGCTGLSTERAGWLYDMTLRGDVVEFTGTDRPMEPYNGWGDWNIPFSEYKQGSAL